jgi:DNA polymerase-4
MDLLSQTPAVVVPKSIDEAYLKMPEHLSYSRPVFALSRAIKANIKKYIGEYLNCSIGIAPNIWLAKMASNYQKPDGLVCVREKDIPNFLSELNLLDFNGISHALVHRFYKIGIYEPLDLYNADFGLLKSAFGVSGAKWYLRLRGYEVDDLAIKRQKSLGHQTTLTPRQTYSLEEIKAVIAKMSHRIGYRLRKKRLQARKLVIALKFVDGNYWLKKYSQSRWFSSDSEIKSICLSQVSQLKNTKLVRRIYITAHDLEEEGYLGNSLFEDLSHLGDLSRAVDQINSKFGKDGIIFASSLNKDFLPDRIGFGNSN